MFPVFTLPLCSIQSAATMTTPTFHFNTILICYNCRRQAVVFITEQVSEAQHNMSLRFVTCGVCGKLPHVFNPGISLRRGYTNLQLYAGIIDHLEDKFNHSLYIYKKRGSFSLTKLATKTVVQIEDCDTLQIDSDNFYPLDHEEGSKFFTGKIVFLQRRVIPTVKLQEDANSSAQGRQTWDSPFVEHPPPPYTISMFTHDIA